MFLALATSKQIRLEWRESEPDLAVLAERERVLQVLSNLVGNALKFTPQGGHVTLNADRESAIVRFSVLDTGCSRTRPEAPTCATCCKRGDPRPRRRRTSGDGHDRS
jgi:signal transduction histidine kinase